MFVPKWAVYWNLIACILVVALLCIDKFLV